VPVDKALFISSTLFDAVVAVFLLLVSVSILSSSSSIFALDVSI